MSPAEFNEKYKKGSESLAQKELLKTTVPAPLARTGDPEPVFTPVPTAVPTPVSSFPEAEDPYDYNTPFVPVPQKLSPLGNVPYHATTLLSGPVEEDYSTAQTLTPPKDSNEQKKRSDQTGFVDSLPEPQAYMAQKSMNLPNMVDPVVDTASRAVKKIARKAVDKFEGLKKEPDQLTEESIDFVKKHKDTFDSMAKMLGASDMVKDATAMAIAEEFSARKKYLWGKGVIDDVQDNYAKLTGYLFFRFPDIGPGNVNEVTAKNVDLSPLKNNPTEYARLKETLSDDSKRKRFLTTPEGNILIGMLEMMSIQEKIKKVHDKQRGLERIIERRSL